METCPLFISRAGQHKQYTFLQNVSLFARNVVAHHHERMVLSVQPSECLFSAWNSNSLMGAAGEAPEGPTTKTTALPEAVGDFGGCEAASAPVFSGKPGLIQSQL